MIILADFTDKKVRELREAFERGLPREGGAPSGLAPEAWRALVDEKVKALMDSMRLSFARSNTNKKVRTLYDRFADDHETLATALATLPEGKRHTVISDTRIPVNLGQTLDEETRKEMEGADWRSIATEASSEAMKEDFARYYPLSRNLPDCLVYETEWVRLEGGERPHFEREQTTVVWALQTLTPTALIAIRRQFTSRSLYIVGVMEPAVMHMARLSMGFRRELQGFNRAAQAQLSNPELGATRVNMLIPYGLANSVWVASTDFSDPERLRARVESQKKAVSLWEYHEAGRQAARHAEGLAAARENIAQQRERVNRHFDEMEQGLGPAPEGGPDGPDFQDK